MSNIKTVNINSMMKKMITIGVMDARLFCGHCQICHPYCRSVDDGCQLKDVMVDIGYARHARIQQKRSPQMYYINIARSAEREWTVKTMDDVISRHDAIDALWKAMYEYEDKTEKQFQESEDLDVGDWILHRVFVQNMSDIDRQTILNLPSAQQWIPCSERLPEYGESVLCYFGTDEDFGVNHIIDEEDGEWFDDGVTAWMPLPEPPYKENSDG